MRPVKLIMSAFGSYAGEEIVDFSKLNTGLFLISGDTGSGKTTILMQSHMRSTIRQAVESVKEI